MSDTGRSKALDLAVASIEKEYGKGAILRLGGGPASGGIRVVSSGSLGLDLALGLGGYPRGRIIEVYGPESSGKTTMTLHAVANAQREGGTAAFIDAEHALDPVYARKLGVDTDSLLISQPDYGEQALEIADMLARSGAVDILVVDSVAALVPKAELEGEMGDSHVGLQARLMSQALRKLTATVARSQCILMFVNQLRMKIGVMFGSPETTTGGQALKFYASVRIDVRRIGSLKDTTTAASDKKEASVTGNRTRIKVVKNKVAPPFREAEFDILYGQGISRTGEVVDLGVDYGLIDKSGAWFSYQGERLGQGREQAKSWLEQHPEQMLLLEQAIFAKQGLVRAGGETTVVPVDKPTESPAPSPRAPASRGAKPTLTGEVP